SRRSRTPSPDASRNSSARTGSFVSASRRPRPSSRFKKSVADPRVAAGGRGRRGALMEAATSLAESTGVSVAVESLGLSRATFYRARTAPSRPEKTPVKKRSPRALSAEERAQLLTALHSDRFVVFSPRTVYATLLDEGRYLGSIRSMYRILEAAQEVRERRNQLRHPSYAKPELLATKPNEVWSWDITKLLGPQKWTYYYLYVILDIFSRHVVGWLLAERESSELAMRLIRFCCNSWFRAEHKWHENSMRHATERRAEAPSSPADAK